MKDEEVDWNPPFKTDSALKDFRHVVTAFKKYIVIILAISLILKYFTLKISYH